MPWTKMVDLSISDEEREEAMAPMAPESRPIYPYGICIRLTGRELGKLALDANVDVGHLIDMRAFGEVTSVSKNGEDCCVEIQIQRIALEDEDTEEPDEEIPAKVSRRYRRG